MSLTQAALGLIPLSGSCYNGPCLRALYNDNLLMYHNSPITLVCMQLSPISPTKEIDVCTQADLTFTLVDSQMQTWGRVLSSKNDWVTILYPLGVLRRSCTIKVPIILGPVKVSSCVEVK